MGKTKQKRDSGKDYTPEEIECMKEYIQKNGRLTSYEAGNEYAKHHKKKTGMERSGSALYMFSWRVHYGRYDKICK